MLIELLPGDQSLVTEHQRIKVIQCWVRRSRWPVRILNGHHPHTILHPRGQVFHKFSYAPYPLLKRGDEFPEGFALEHLILRHADEKLSRPGLDGGDGQGQQLPMAVVHPVKGTADGNAVV